MNSRADAPGVSTSGHLDLESTRERCRNRDQPGHGSSPDDPDQRCVSRETALCAGAAIAAGWLLLALWAVHPTRIGTFQDDGIYVSTARSLAENSEYRLVNLPTAPSQTKYPPIFPILLSLIWRVAPDFPSNVILFKAVGVVCWALSMLLAQRLALDALRVSPLASLGLVTLSAGSVLALTHLNFVLTEPLYTVLSMLAILLATQSRETDRPRALAAGAVAALAYLTRVQGLALIFAVSASFGWKRDWRSAGKALAPGCVAIAGWRLWCISRFDEPSMLLGYYVSYQHFSASGASRSFLLDLLATVSFHLIDVPQSIARFLVALSPGIDWWLGIALLVLTAVGSISLMRKGHPALVLFVGSSLAVTMALPWFPQRLVMPIFPGTLVLACVGGKQLLRLVKQRFAPIGRICALAILVFAQAFQATILAREVTRRDSTSLPRSSSLSTGRSEWPELEEAFRWILLNVPRGTGVAAAHDAMIYLHTNRPSLRYWPYDPRRAWLSRFARLPPATSYSPAEVRRELLRLRVGWLLVDQRSEDLVPGAQEMDRFLVDLLRGGSSPARLAFRSSRGSIGIWELENHKEPDP